MSTISQQQFIVAIQDTPAELCVTDCVDGLSCEVWSKLEGINTPILSLGAADPLDAAMRYLECVGFPEDKLDSISVNLDEYTCYRRGSDGRWEQAEI